MKSTLNHIHLVTRDKFELAKWYQETLGFEVIADIEALGEKRGPLYISADGGKILGRRALEKVRTCIRLSAERVNDTQCKRRLEVTKSNSKYPPALGVTMGDAGNEYDADPPPPPEDREKEEKVSSRTVECMDWLKAYLADSPKPVSELRTAGENKGFSSKTIYDARAQLRLTETQVAGRKWWGLTDEPPTPPTFKYGTT